jgi:predicted RNA-binding Zn ribbon-like protein
MKPANRRWPVYAQALVSYERIDLVHPALDLVNSRHGNGPDLLDDPDWLSDYLGRWGFDAAGKPDRRDHAALVDLRGLMRQIVEAVGRGEPPARPDLERLNRILARGRLTPALETVDSRFELRLVPARRDWAAVRSQLASALAELLARGEADRLKVCADEGCRFAFYDESRNRARRWCSHTTCGNRHKVRRYRARRRTGYSASR